MARLHWDQHSRGSTAAAAQDGRADHRVRRPLRAVVRYCCCWCPAPSQRLLLTRYGSAERSEFPAAHGIRGDQGGFRHHRHLLTPDRTAARSSTTAVRDGADYVINGTKYYISGVDEGRSMIVVTRTAPKLSLFWSPPTHPVWSNTGCPWASAFRRTVHLALRQRAVLKPPIWSGLSMTASARSSTGSAGAPHRSSPSAWASDGTPSNRCGLRAPAQ